MCVKEGTSLEVTDVLPESAMGINSCPNSECFVIPTPGSMQDGDSLPRTLPTSAATSNTICS